MPTCSKTPHAPRALPAPALPLLLPLGLRERPAPPPWLPNKLCETRSHLQQCSLSRPHNLPRPHSRTWPLPALSGTALLYCRPSSAWGLRYRSNLGANPPEVLSGPAAAGGPGAGGAMGSYLTALPVSDWSLKPPGLVYSIASPGLTSLGRAAGYKGAARSNGIFCLEYPGHSHRLMESHSGSSLQTCLLKDISGWSPSDGQWSSSYFLLFPWNQKQILE